MVVFGIGALLIITGIIAFISVVSTSTISTGRVSADKVVFPFRR
jgi:hypothetical protein